MRVTNGMMRNNSLMNMQKNKIAYNKHLTEYNTQKKIQRPSDDPTIAVRSLKYRTTLSEIDQYLTNIDDATSWMNNTETCLNDINGRLQEMMTYCTQAANDLYSAKDREDIVAQLKEYVGYIYEQNGNSDYAGRYLFTGYRTDVPLLFDQDQSNETYTITEKIEIENINAYKFVYGEAVYDASKDATDYATEASQFVKTHRALVSYSDCDEDKKDVSITYKDVNGVEKTVTAVTKSIADDVTYNEHLNPGPNEVFFVPETGEILIGDSIYDDVRSGSDFSITYQKTNFKRNDIRPEHYFDCQAYDNVTEVLSKYKNPQNQEINYQINFNQTLSINTMACNAIDTSASRAVDNISNLCNELSVMDNKLTAVKKRIADCDENNTEELKSLNELKKQIETEMSLHRTVITDALGSAITTCQKMQDKLNVALANHGSRYSRMAMTKTKLQDQEIDVEEAKSENEDADIGDAYVNFTEANLLYQSTLQATSKVLGQSLLNFI